MPSAYPRHVRVVMGLAAIGLQPDAQRNVLAQLWRAMACNVRRHWWYCWRRWQRRISNLQTGRGYRGFEYAPSPPSTNLRNPRNLAECLTSDHMHVYLASGVRLAS
jgi:hypothetical protein